MTEVKKNESVVKTKPSLLHRSTGLMRKFLGSDYGIEKGGNFLKRLMEGKESVVKEINKDYTPKKKEKEKKKKKVKKKGVEIKLNPEGLLGGVSKRQKMLDEIDKY